MEYAEIIVRISPRAAPIYGVAVSSPLGGSCESTLALPFGLEELAGIVFGVAQTVRDMTPVDLSTLGEAGVPPAASDSDARVDAARGFGEQLFEALFQGQARSVFDGAMAAAQALHVGLRIRLSMDLRGDGMTVVASLPWELMRPKGNRPLAVSSQTLLVRSPDTVQPSEPRAFAPPLRILLVVSNPQGSAPLNLEEERARITKIWGPLPDVRVDSCAPVVADLLDKLRESDYHVIHYMGHGQFDQGTGRGALVLATDDGRPDLVSGEDLAVYLRDELPLLRLVFLNACKTATTGARTGADPFAGIATALIQAGLPAVVAMQFPISDRAAITFSETFYQRLAKGDPVDVAMAESRKKIWHLDEWATPVLFLRSKDGVLFEPPRVATPADAQARAMRQEDDPALATAFSDGSPDSPRVFLATPCEALVRVHKQIAKKLKEEGVRIVDAVPREEPAKHAARVQRIVRSADLSVHLLGEHPGAPLDDDEGDASRSGALHDGGEGDSLRTYTMQELDIGIEAAPSQLVLIPDTVDLEQPDDPAYAARIDALVRMPRTARQFELITADKNQLAPEILAKLKRLAEARSTTVAAAATGGEVQTALVDLHHSDLDSAQDLLRHLSSRNINWVMTASQGSPAEALAAFEASLSRVQLYIVVYGRVVRDWVDHRLNAALQRGAMADSLTRCIGVYLAPPLKGAEATSFSPSCEVADNMAGFDATTIEALIARAAR